MSRIEYAQKDELVPIDDVRHGMIVPVVRGTVGYLVEMASVQRLTVAVGAAASLTSVGAGVRADYGGRPRSVLALVELRSH